MLTGFLKKAMRWVGLGRTQRGFGQGRRALDAEEIGKALRLKGQGLSDRRVAALSGLNRATVARLWLTSGSVEEIVERLLKRHMGREDWEALAERYVLSKLESNHAARKGRERRR